MTTHDYTIVTNSGNKFYIHSLSEELCKTYCKEIFEIINIIPYIHWTEKELFLDDDFFKNKWQYSLVVKDSTNKIVGVLIAYFRLADDKHIIDALYLHKLAIKPEYQKNGIGTELVKYFIKKSYAEISWLWNISLQTNDEIKNQYVMDFYQKIGFIRYYNIEYANKRDILMVYERDNFNDILFCKDVANLSFNPKKLKHPRITIVENKIKQSKVPVIYFASTNERKKSLVKFIFNNYNIEVVFEKPIINLVEPQVENADVNDEQNLVHFPLKLISRFISNTPYVIEDSMLFIEFFNRNGLEWELPGHDTKRWWKQLGTDGILNILGHSQKRRAKFVSQIGAYMESKKYYFGRGETNGTIAHNTADSIENQKGTYSSFFHLVFIPDNANKTLAEMNMYEFSKYDYIRKSILEFLCKIKSIPIDTKEIIYQLTIDFQ